MSHTWIAVCSQARMRLFEVAGDRGLQALQTIENDSSQDMFDDQFVREIAEDLESHRRRHDFGRLVIAAEPRFLGRIRKALDDDTCAMVTRWVLKDLDRQTPPEIARALNEWPDQAH